MKRKIFFIFLLLAFVCCIEGSYLFARTYLRGFELSEIDEADSSNLYYGYQSISPSDIDWYLVNITTYNVRYIVGQNYSNYDIAWSTRAYITYLEPKDVYANPY